MPHLPNLDEERKLWKKGYQIVIGLDEVGRGAFAGPIVVSACAFTSIPPLSSRLRFNRRRDLIQTNVGLRKIPRGYRLAPPRNDKITLIESLGINDSKKLSPRKRQQLAKLIQKHALTYSFGEIGVSTINQVGIGRATFMAMRKAVKNILNNELRIKNKGKKWESLHNSKTFLLVDAFHIKYVKGIGLKQQKAIVKGDQKSISIAAASILAKVYRDQLMTRLHKRYRKYGWKKNKGYGTKSHQQAIKKHGLTKHHRKQFVETWSKKFDGR